MQIEKRIFIRTCSGYDHDDYKDGEWGRLSGSSVQNPRGQTVGLNCRTLAKAKTQLAKASPKPNKSQVDRHRRESFAKVSNWQIFYTCKIASNKIRRAPRKQILWIFTARKVRVWLRKHRESTPCMMKWQSPFEHRKTTNQSNFKRVLESMIKCERFFCTLDWTWTHAHMFAWGLQHGRRTLFRGLSTWPQVCKLYTSLGWETLWIIQTRHDTEGTTNPGQGELSRNWRLFLIWES